MSLGIVSFRVSNDTRARSPCVERERGGGATFAFENDGNTSRGQCAAIFRCFARQVDARLSNNSRPATNRRNEITADKLSVISASPPSPSPFSRAVDELTRHSLSFDSFALQLSCIIEQGKETEFLDRKRKGGAHYLGHKAIEWTPRSVQRGWTNVCQVTWRDEFGPGIRGTSQSSQDSLFIQEVRASPITPRIRRGRIVSTITMDPYVFFYFSKIEG